MIAFLKRLWGWSKVKAKKGTVEPDILKLMEDIYEYTVTSGKDEILLTPEFYRAVITEAYKTHLMPISGSYFDGVNYRGMPVRTRRDDP